MDKIKLTIGATLWAFVVFTFFYFISDWVLNLVNSLLLLWDYVGFLEMPHKFYGLVIIFFISWKLLEAVINVWFMGLKYSFNLVKEATNGKV